MNQTEFAALLGASRNQVSNWERGRTGIPLDKLQLLQAATGVTVDRLCGQELTRESLPEQPFSAQASGAETDPVLQEIKVIRRLLEDVLDILRHGAGNE